MTNNTPRVGGHSPWDRIDSVEPVAGGIVSVSTPGHGGFWVPADLNKLIPACVRNADGWYEEDCEYAIPVVCLDAITFDPRLVEGAHKTFKAYWPTEYQTVTGKSVSLDESHVLRDLARRKANAGKLIAVSASGKAGGIVIVAACVNGHNDRGGYADKLRYFAVPETSYNTRGEGGFVVGDPDQTLYAEAAEADFYA